MGDSKREATYFNYLRPKTQIFLVVSVRYESYELDRGLLGCGQVKRAESQDCRNLFRCFERNSEPSEVEPRNLHSARGLCILGQEARGTQPSLLYAPCEPHQDGSCVSEAKGSGRGCRIRVGGIMLKASGSLPTNIQTKGRNSNSDVLTPVALNSTGEMCTPRFSDSLSTSGRAD